ncbi:adenylate/guanylate cyclase domain-containing protein [Roseibium denhamense]|uniref:Adenylate cyclase n=1 Tax=Roseibium denhamense TaxID=76305 RepID=A0ABY1P2I8_9HYPH|nr:adenylate/guanylate cyclase domain-containing protein [Roseibium denhamense]MTI07552.1 adenylate/guanylate cyclase domain-containing protein [Roseibium denhamense]SMP23858.1 adenylate cyclase [Roseibium denhamense]
MSNHLIDPAPRSYVPTVYLRARSDRGPACAPEKQTLDDVRKWLLYEASGNNDVLLLFEEFMWRCHAAGLAIDRSTLHVGTLHPQFIGFSWMWNATDGLCDEIAADARSLESEAFRRSPLFKVMSLGETIKVDLATEEGRQSAPIMLELAEEGYTFYGAMPLSNGSGQMRNAMTLATKHPGGWPEEVKDEIRKILDLFAFHVERHILVRIAQNVADTYLGPIAGRRVLDGEIKRGDGESIQAVVFMCDMRGFTGLADRLSGPDVTAILNAYFDLVSDAVLNNGGDILKFMGDGILAVFDQNALGADKAAEAALSAARTALSAIDQLNTAPKGLPDKSLWHPIRIGIGLHQGEVFFGNVGGEDRLDFTVIGRAVNETSRVEALCKPLGQTLLLTEPVRAALPGTFHDELSAMGDHALRGVGQPVAIYASGHAHPSSSAPQPIS